METILEVKDICKSFGKKQVLKDVSFSVRPGEILGFVGPNGAGKTTTIKLILGLQSIDSGSVFINGCDIKKDFENAIREVGAIVENPDAYMYLSGYDNLKLSANLYRNVSNDRINEVVELVGLFNRIRDKVSKYSLGMRQRLGIAMSLLHNPKVLILDEPTNGLDPEGIKELRELIKKLARKEQMAILISSHNLAELESFVTDVCFIKNGVVIKNASIDEVKTTGDNPTYIITLDKIEGLKSVLKREFTVQGKSIVIPLKHDEVPEVIETLVKNKYKIFSVVQAQVSLEDAFLKELGGNVID